MTAGLLQDYVQEERVKELAEKLDKAAGKERTGRICVFGLWACICEEAPPIIAS